MFATSFFRLIAYYGLIANNRPSEYLSHIIKRFLLLTRFAAYNPVLEYIGVTHLSSALPEAQEAYWNFKEQKLAFIWSILLIFSDVT